MRCCRMRGYGSFCIGWNEAQRTKYEPDNNNNGCLAIIAAVFVICLISAMISVGTFWGFVIGLAILVGMFGPKK